MGGPERCLALDIGVRECHSYSRHDRVGSYAFSVNNPSRTHVRWIGLGGGSLLTEQRAIQLTSGLEQTALPSGGGNREADVRNGRASASGVSHLCASV